MKFKYGCYKIEVEDCDNISKKEIQKAVITTIKALDSETFKPFEVLWYNEHNSQNEPHTKEFKTRKEALTFYEEHKNDEDKFDWWVTKRDKNWYVIEDIIF